MVIGLAPDRDGLFEALREREARKGQTYSAIGHLVPIDHTLAFDIGPEGALQTALKGLCEAVTPYADRLDDSRFHVRVVRRGLKGVLHSQALEQHLAGHLVSLLEARGNAPRIAFDDTDAVVLVETLGTVCGVGLLTRELSNRYPFIHAR